MTTIFEWLQEHMPRRDPEYNNIPKANFVAHELQIDIEQVMHSFDDLHLEYNEAKLDYWKNKVDEIRELTASSGWFAP